MDGESHAASTLPSAWGNICKNLNQLLSTGRQRSAIMGSERESPDAPLPLDRQSPSSAGEHARLCIPAQFAKKVHEMEESNQ